MYRKLYNADAYMIKELLCCLVHQSMMSASADSTTAMRMPCASTWLEATAAPVSPATLVMGQSAKVSTAVLLLLFILSSAQPIWTY